MRNLTNTYHSTLESVRADTLVKARLSPLEPDNEWEILAIGKAALAMTTGALEVLDASTPAFVLTKHGHGKSHLESGQVQTWQAGHPLPDQDGIRATRALLEWIQRPIRRSNLLLLLSGGTSSLLIYPSPPLNLESLVELNSALLASGAPIQDINVIRKHLSRVKGGQLGLRLLDSYSQVHQLTLCDVCLENVSELELLSLIGSGPAVADPSTQAKAKSLLETLELKASLRSQVESALRETPKKLSITTEILADHRTLQETALKFCWQPLKHSSWEERVRSDIAALAPLWAELAKTLHGQGHRGTLIATGEPTVHLDKTPGRGGRCQELALLFAQAISGVAQIALLAGSSDGTDGPTDYAGAVVDNTTWARLCEYWGEDKLLSLLVHHDSTTALEALPGLLLKTGPTGQNINDLYMIELR